MDMTQSLVHTLRQDGTRSGYVATLTPRGAKGVPSYSPILPSLPVSRDAGAHLLILICMSFA